MSASIPLNELTDFVKRILQSAGADNKQTQIFTKALIWSDLIGRPTHGVWRLPAYVKRMTLGLIKCPCELHYTHTTDELERAVELLDGDAGFGHYVGHEAMVRSIAKAKKFGIGAIGVHNSNHFGTGAYYVQLAAEQGMLGFAVSNSISKVAPHGGFRSVFGTNPFAFGAPRRNGKSLMLDMATTAIAGAQVMKYAEQGKDLPEGIAIDPQGQPIIDPNRVGEGSLLPFGGAKGYGLSLMIEILSSVITGAVFSRDVSSMFTNFEQTGGNGHFFIAVDIDKFIGLETFYDRMDELLQQVKAAGVEEDSVMIPGEARWKAYERSLSEGVSLDTATVQALNDLSEQHSIPSLFS